MRTTLCAALAAALLLPVHAVAGDPAQESAETSKEPTVQETIAHFEAMCAASTEAREQRQTERSLYERLGGEEGVRELTAEIMRLHRENDHIGHFFATPDPEAGVEAASRYFIWKTGGPKVYDGPSLPDSHAHMGITDADFVAAGGDVLQAMKSLGYEKDEIDEFVCLLVERRAKVVHPTDTSTAQ